MELEDSTLSVVCGDLTGLLLLENFSARRECVSCEHGLVKPATFERLAGKGHCKSWKRTVKCAETGKDICSLIEAGVLQLMDEPQWVVKRRETIKLNKSLNAADEGDVPPKRKRGRPKKSEIGVNGQTPESGKENAIVDKLGNGNIRKRKKLKGSNDSPKAAKANKTCSKENGHVNNGFPSQLNGMSQSGASPEVYRRAPRHGKCKRKRVRHNDFERSVNAIIRDQQTPTMTLRFACPVCKTKVQDAEALKYHDLMFHSSVSSRVFMPPGEADSSTDTFPDLTHCGADSSINFPLVPGSYDEHEESNPDVKCFPNLDVFEEKLTRGTVAKLASIGIGSSVKGGIEGPCSSRENSNAHSEQMSILSTIAQQYQEILGVSQDALQQTCSLRAQMEVLAKSVEELKADVKDLSKTITLSNMAKSAVRDDITAGDYQTFFNILEKFLNSNGFGNGNGNGIAR